MRARTFVAILVALTLAPTLLDPAQAQPPGAEARTEPSARYLIAFRAVPEEAHRGSYQGERVTALLDGLRMALIETPNAAALESKARHDPNVRYFERDAPHHARLDFVPNDARYGDAGHWGTKKIGAEAAWDRTLGSTAVKVAMIDSGLNKNHEEFLGSARILQGHDFATPDTDPDDTSGCSWHGTHTTGTAGATIHNGKGIAGLSQHTILPVKAFIASSWGCTSSISALVFALKYAADQGAHISSNSWSAGGSSSALNDAIQYAHDRGVVHVSSAGNSGSCANCVGYPWREMGHIVIVVASSTSSDALSSFSSEGPQVDVVAPGSGVLSTTSAPSGYGLLSGTSMAAPHVTGVAALLKALQPTYRFTEIESRIKATATDIGLSADRQGAGRLDADAATAGLGPPAAPPMGADTMHVHAISVHRKGSPTKGDVHIKISIADAREADVAGATVCIEVSRNGALATSGCLLTNTDGTATYVVARGGSGTYTTCVTDVTKTDWAWDAGADHAAAGRCETSSA